MKKTTLWILFICFTMTMAIQLIAQPAPVDPVNWRKLAPFLSELKGWQARGDINGSTVNTGGFKMSTVEQRFVNNGQRLRIQIIDGGYAPMAYAGFRAMSQFEIDTSDELVKKTTIKGFTAIENYKFKNKNATILILIKDRFLIQLETKGIEDIAELKAVAMLLDLKGLAALAK